MIGREARTVSSFAQPNSSYVLQRIAFSKQVRMHPAHAYDLLSGGCQAVDEREGLVQSLVDDHVYASVVQAELAVFRTDVNGIELPAEIDIGVHAIGSPHFPKRKKGKSGEDK